MKIETIIRFFKYALVILGLASAGILIKVVTVLDIVPMKYYVAMIIVLVLLNIIGIVTLLIKKVWTKIISIIVYIIIFAISIIGINYGNKTIEFFEEGFDNEVEKITTYYVVVSNDSKYQNLDDLNGSNMGYLNVGDFYISSYISSKVEIDLIEYSSAYTLYEDLTENGLKSMIIEEVYLDLLEEEYVDLNEKIKIIETFEIEDEETIDIEEEPKEEISYDEAINIYITGSDSRSGKITNKSRTDVNMVMTINPKTRTILLTSIPRDYYVQLHGTKGLKDKLTHSGVYGMNMSKKTVEDLLDIKIDYTVKVGFNSVIEVVDLVGGIDIYSETAHYAFCSDGGAKSVNIKKGKNHLNGREALCYVRQRKIYASGDNQRIKNQQQVLEAIIDKASNDRSLLLKYDELLESLKSLYRTDIPDSLIKAYIKNQLNDMSEWTVKNQYLTGKGAYKETYTMPGRDLYVMIPNSSSVDKATKKIESVMDAN